LSGAEIAFGDDLIIRVFHQSAVKTGYSASPAAHTLLRVNAHHSAYRVLLHGSGQTGVNAPGPGAVPALDGETNLAVLLHAYPGQRARSLFLKCLYDVLRVRVLYLTIATAKAAAHTGFFIDIDSLHFLTLHGWIFLSFILKFLS
jgi:hypothetical protein